MTCDADRLQEPLGSLRHVTCERFPEITAHRRALESLRSLETRLVTPPPQLVHWFLLLRVCVPQRSIVSHHGRLRRHFGRRQRRVRLEGA